MKNIHRQKSVHSHSWYNTHGQGDATREIECQNLNAIIENLKRDKEHILLELQTKEQEKKRGSLSCEGIACECCHVKFTLTKFKDHVV